MSASVDAPEKLAALGYALSNSSSSSKRTRGTLARPERTTSPSVTLAITVTSEQSAPGSTSSVDGATNSTHFADVPATATETRSSRVKSRVLPSSNVTETLSALVVDTKIGGCDAISSGDVILPALICTTTAVATGSCRSTGAVPLATDVLHTIHDTSSISPHTRCALAATSTPQPPSASADATKYS